MVKNLNYLEYEVNDKKLFIIKDHSVALLCWYKVFKNNLIQKNTTLFHIDKHPDFCYNDSLKEKSLKLLDMSEEEITRYILNELRNDNSEFIVDAMFSKLIKDGICISYNSCSYYGNSIDGSYSTTKKKQFISEEIEHNYYLEESQNISNIVGYQALIGDSCVHQDTDKLFKEANNLILDIDLDFFTYLNEINYAKNSLDIKNQITSESFKEIFSKSKVITIALEPECCGGIQQCLEILNVFNEELFKPNNLDIYKEIKQKFLEEKS